MQRGAEVLTIGPDPEVAFKLYWARQKLPFPGLSDSQHVVADRYGQEVKLLKFGRMPALMVLDKQGRVRFAHYAEDMRDYPTIQELYDVLEQLAQQEKRDKPKAA